MFNKAGKKEIEEMSNSHTTVAKGTVLEGNVETLGNIRIEGKLTGNIKCKSKVVLGESSLVEGNVYAQNAEISGEVKGVLQISDVLILRATAIVTGDIITGKMIVESGATFNGQCKMGATIKEIEIGEEEYRKEKTA